MHPLSIGKAKRVAGQGESVAGGPSGGLFMRRETIIESPTLIRQQRPTPTTRARHAATSVTTTASLVYDRNITSTTVSH